MEKFCKALAAAAHGVRIIVGGDAMVAVDCWRGDTGD